MKKRSYLLLLFFSYFLCGHAGHEDAYGHYMQGFVGGTAVYRLSFSHERISYFVGPLLLIGERVFILPPGSCALLWEQKYPKMQIAFIDKGCDGSVNSLRKDKDDFKEIKRPFGMDIEFYAADWLLKEVKYRLFLFAE